LSCPTIRALGAGALGVAVAPRRIDVFAQPLLVDQRLGVTSVLVA
jgi:hypothetical protein